MTRNADLHAADGDDDADERPAGSTATFAAAAVGLLGVSLSVAGQAYDARAIALLAAALACAFAALARVRLAGAAGGARTVAWVALLSIAAQGITLLVAGPVVAFAHVLTPGTAMLFG